MENNLNLSEEQPVLFDKSGIRDVYNLDCIMYKYEKIRIFNDELAAVKDNGKWGFIDKYGNVIINY